ncbi:hypothetical protein DH09_15905 [Bacillaceae bacterium JMAK1]|nr:hypothetical protein DH09_15905 [Bacillaceae bacterium JMAK1]
MHYRLDVVDQLRGFALCGLPFVNMMIFFQGKFMYTDQPLHAWLERSVLILMEGRFISIFSLLFGLSVFLFVDRKKVLGDALYLRYAKRLSILVLLGMMHMMIYPGDVLLLYGVYGIVLLPCVRLPKPLLLTVGIIGTVAATVTTAKFLLPLPLMILGLAVGKYRIFERISKTIVTRLVVITGLFSVLAFIYLETIAPSFPIQLYEPLAHVAFAERSFMLWPIFTCLYIALIVRFSNVLRFLIPIGKMPITIYISQSILLLLLSPSDLITLGQAVTTSAIIVIVCFICSHVWLRFFSIGPLEWLVRTGTNTEVSRAISQR